MMSHLLRASHLLGEIISLLSSLNRPPEHHQTQGGHCNTVIHNKLKSWVKERPDVSWRI